MAKRRTARQALGVLTRADGTRVEVKNPTVWRHLVTQQELLESLKQAIAAVGAERDALKGELHMRKIAFDDLADNWWVNLGARLGLVRLRDLRVVAAAAAVAGSAETAPLAGRDSAVVEVPVAG